MKKIILVTVVLTMGFACGAVAQTPMALTNVGQRLDTEDARMVGRGGWGMAVDDSTHPGFKNIASLYSVQKVALNFSAFGDHTVSESNEGKRTTYRVFTPDMRVALPVIKGRLAVTAGFVVDRSSQFATSQDSIWNVWEDEIRGEVQFLREGSTFRVPLGLAFSPVSGLSLSGAINLQRGTLRESLYYLMQEPTTLTGLPLYQTNLLVQEDSYAGTSSTFSALLKPHARLRFGLSYTPSYTLAVDRKIEMGGVAQRATSAFDLEFPAELKLGFTAKGMGDWWLGADFERQDFHDFRGLGDWDADMNTEQTVSVGLERHRGHVRHAGFANLPLRFGFRTRTWAYLVGGSPVHERTFSVGTGFPFRGDLGQLDLAFSYSLVGDLEDNGMQSRVARLAISVTGLEKWW